MTSDSSHMSESSEKSFSSITLTLLRDVLFSSGCPFRVHMQHPYSVVKTRVYCQQPLPDRGQAESGGPLDLPPLILSHPLNP